MEEIFIAILQGVIEFVLEVLSSGWDWWPKSSAPDNRSWRDPIRLTCFLWFVVGCVLAWVSTLVFKFTIIRWSTVRMLNLIAAPLASAWLSKAIATRRQKVDPFVDPRFHFWRSFWFVFGLALIRFAYAVRV